MNIFIMPRPRPGPSVSKPDVFKLFSAEARPSPQNYVQAHGLRARLGLKARPVQGTNTHTDKLILVVL